MGVFVPKTFIAVALFNVILTRPTLPADRQLTLLGSDTPIILVRLVMLFKKLLLALLLGPSLALDSDSGDATTSLRGSSNTGRRLPAKPDPKPVPAYKLPACALEPVPSQTSGPLLPSTVSAKYALPPIYLVAHQINTKSAKNLYGSIFVLTESMSLSPALGVKPAGQIFTAFTGASPNLPSYTSKTTNKVYLSLFYSNRNDPIGYNIVSPPLDKDVTYQVLMGIDTTNGKMAMLVARADTGKVVDYPAPIPASDKCFGPVCVLDIPKVPAPAVSIFEPLITAGQSTFADASVGCLFIGALKPLSGSIAQISSLMQALILLGQ